MGQRPRMQSQFSYGKGRMIQKTKPRPMENNPRKVVLDLIKGLATCAPLDIRISIDQSLLPFEREYL